MAGFEYSQEQIEILDSVRGRLPEFYLPAGYGEDQMPFHNIDHALHTDHKTAEYLDYVTENCLRIDGFAVRFAALMHDANYHHNMREVNAFFRRPTATEDPFPSKESYASWQAMRLAQEDYGIHTRQAKRIGRTIMGTHVDVQPVSLGQKILVRADLDNISGPQQPFLVNTLRLVREAEMLDGPKNPLERVAFLHSILSSYVGKDLCLGDFDRDVYNTLFRDPAAVNIARLASHNVRSSFHALGGVAAKLFTSGED